MTPHVPRRAARPLLPLSLAGAAVLSVGAGLVLWALSGRLDQAAAAPAELALSLAALGAFVLWHRPGDRIGGLLAVTGLLFALGVLAAGGLLQADRAGGAWHPASEVALACLWMTAGLAAPWCLFVLWFPTGEIGSSGWRRFFALAVALCVALPLCGYLFAPAGAVAGIFSVARLPSGAGGPFAGAAGAPLTDAANALLLLPLVAVIRLRQRYGAGGTVVRQQIKWLAAAAVATVLGAAVASALTPAGDAGRTAALAVTLVTQPLPAVATAVAILRHRLWQIEVVVSRTLVHAVLWLLLSALLLVPALATGVVVGGPGTVAAVGIALLVSLAFEPLRTRLEGAVERLVFRGRPRGYTLLTRLSETLRAGGTLVEMGEQVAGGIREGLGVTWAGVWVLLDGGSGRVLHSVGGAPAQGRVSMVLPEAAARSLLGAVDRLDPVTVDALSSLWPEPAAAVIPLVAGDETVGVLACGDRPGDRLADVDLQVLGLLARECALAFRARRLELELRERLDQIERQAEELRLSRQRLVTVQDVQRRRIERDLHDGVQQQLVSLAVRLRRLGARGDVPGTALEDVAAEAEEAVFALQELARGIFPSVLADQGLPAALRAQAARMPLDVHVAVEPGLAQRRFDPDVEAALYFVALEAMANAQKHAPEASLSVSLRVAAEGRTAVLEVQDNGPGFDPTVRGAGTGLQNMADRVSAAGGELRVESTRGEGTWIRAEVPLALRGALLHMADSRR